MDEKKKRRVGVAAIAVPALTVGTVALVSAYQADNDFQPFSTDRELQKNQVVFSDSEDAVEQQEKSQGEESEYWKKDGDSNQEKSPTAGSQDGKYLFENGLLNQENQAQNSITILGDSTTGTTQNQSGQGDTSGQPVYRLTDNKGQADVILQGNGSQAAASTGQSNGDSGENKDSSDRNGTQEDSKNQGEDKNNGQNGSNSDTKKDDPLIPTPVTPTPTPTPDTPTVRPADTAEDPDSSKTMPDRDLLGDSKSYTEDASSDFKNPEYTKRVTIVYAMDSDNLLYKGQKVDQKKIYNSLMTFASITDSKGNTSYYVWGSSALDQYVRIEAVSFDEGETWSEEFPLTIPKNVESGIMQVKVGYRFSTSDTAWEEEIVNCQLEDSRIYVMSEPITEENQTIDAEKVLNGAQHLEEGSKLNLLYYQNQYLGSDQLTSLFPGWSENGKLVDWFYPVTIGRHILEPEDPVPLDSAYTAQLRLVWMSDTYDVGFDYGNLCYLQTLTNVDKSIVQSDENGQTSLEVPEYMQAVVMDDDADISVDYIEIPDSVLYIAGNSDGLKVKKGYSVGENNPCYAMADHGILTNKAGTEYLNIPYEKETVTVEEGVTKVAVSTANAIHTLQIEASSMEDMPEISYENLQDCKIVVKEEVLEDFVRANWNSLKNDPDNCVATNDDPTHTYRMKYGCLIDQNGSVRRLVDTAGKKVQLAADVTNIEEDAFAGIDSVTTLVMPKTGETVHLDQNCFRNCGLTTILCYTPQQYRAMIEQLKDSGASEDIQVELLATSREGYTYTMGEENGETEVTLISVPDDLEIFDGTMTDEQGNPITLTAVDEYAFGEAENLEWVILPESIKKIGYEAFWNCTSLQGVMIESQDVIEIGDQAFDGCNALRFVASNAMQAVMNDYVPYITDTFGNSTFFSPTNSEGYNGSIWFTEESGVCSYQLVELGEKGKALYGTDESGEPWLLLRSGGYMDAQIHLPSTTLEIWSQALEYTRASGGKYTVNWEDLGQLWMDSGAFYNSELGGDITLGDGCYLAGYAMYNCDQITSVTMGDYIGQIGEGAFGSCSSLQTVQFGTMQYGVALYSGLFNDCDQLTSITFNDYVAPGLTIFGTSGFQFNFGWTQEEERANLKIRIPEGSEMSYIKTWRYFYAGYADAGDYPAYLNMWYDIRYAYMDWETWEFPPDEEVDEMVEAALLEAENRIRAMIGADAVTCPSEYYWYHLDNEGMLSLAGTPSDITTMNLWMQLDNLPDNWFLDYIGTGAFKRAKNLEMVLIPYSITGIYTHAFDGIESSSLMLYMMAETPPELKGWSKDEPFVFGTTETPIYLMVPDGSEENYLQSWIFPMAGYDDLSAMREGVKEELTAAGQDDSDQAVDIEVANRLLPLENQLRDMLGMEQITDIHDLCVTLENLPEKEETTDPDESEAEATEVEEKVTEEKATEEKAAETADSGATDTEETEEEPKKEEQKETSSDEEKQDAAEDNAKNDTDSSQKADSIEEKGTTENTDTASETGSGEETQE